MNDVAKVLDCGIGCLAVLLLWIGWNVATVADRLGRIAAALEKSKRPEFPPEKAEVRHE